MSEQQARRPMTEKVAAHPDDLSASFETLRGALEAVKKWLDTEAEQLGLIRRGKAVCQECDASPNKPHRETCPALIVARHALTVQQAIAALLVCAGREQQKPVNVELLKTLMWAMRHLRSHISFGVDGDVYERVSGHELAGMLPKWDAAEALIAKVQAQPSGWSVLSSAQKDGTPILRHHKIWGPIAVKYQPTETNAGNLPWLNTDLTTAWPEDAFTPHWMPLPPVPQEGSER